MSDSVLPNKQQTASIIKLGKQDALATSRMMLALARKGGDAPASLSHEEIQELCLTVEIHYAQMGLS